VVSNHNNLMIAKDLTVANVVGSLSELHRTQHECANTSYVLVIIDAGPSDVIHPATHPPWPAFAGG
jgi:hypothetical protein